MGDCYCTYCYSAGAPAPPELEYPPHQMHSFTFHPLFNVRLLLILPVSSALQPTAFEFRQYINVPVFCTNRRTRTAHQNTQIKICEVPTAFILAYESTRARRPPHPAPQDCAAPVHAREARAAVVVVGGGGRRSPGSGRPREPSPRCASGPRCGGARQGLRRRTKMPPPPKNLNSSDSKKFERVLRKVYTYGQRVGGELKMVPADRKAMGEACVASSAERFASRPLARVRAVRSMSTAA